MRVCEVDECSNEAKVKGLCQKHYVRLKKHGDPLKTLYPTRGMDDKARFDLYVEKTDGCWLWTGYKCHKGYGRFKYNKKWALAHRVSWVLNFGEIKQIDNSYHGVCVCHKCDNPRCVNPEHLFLGTQKDNMHDMDRKGRTGFRFEKGNKVRKPVGEESGKSKITEATVFEIRSKYKFGVYGYQKIADEYGLGRSTIHSIIKRLTWKHI